MEMSNETKRELLATCSRGELEIAINAKQRARADSPHLGSFADINSTALGVKKCNDHSVQFTHNGDTLSSTYFSLVELSLLATRLERLAEDMGA